MNSPANASRISSTSLRSRAIRLLKGEPFETIWVTMQISARNVLKGKVAKVVEGAVNCEVTLEIAPGVEIVSIITKASAASLGLVEGKAASAVIKASSVMIAVD
jgi:molybdopterin-binding protein